MTHYIDIIITSCGLPRPIYTIKYMRNPMYWHKCPIWALDAHLVALQARNGGSKGSHQALAQHKSPPHHIKSLSTRNHVPHHLRSVQNRSLYWAKVVSLLQS